MMLLQETGEKRRTAYFKTKQMILNSIQLKEVRKERVEEPKVISAKLAKSAFFVQIFPCKSIIILTIVLVVVGEIYIKYKF